MFNGITYSASNMFSSFVFSISTGKISTFQILFSQYEALKFITRLSCGKANYQKAFVNEPSDWDSNFCEF